MDSAYWDSGAVVLVTCQRACVNQKWLMGWLYCCFQICDVHIDIGATLNTYYSACVLFVDVSD